MNYAKKDVVLNLNGEAGLAIFSVSIIENMKLCVEEQDY